MFNNPINRWWTVVAGALGNMVSAGIVANFTFGIFIKTISAEYGWERGTVTFCYSCFVLASGVGHLMLGGIMNRWGVRPPSILFVAIFGASTAAVALLPNSVALFYLTFAIMGYFGAAATPMPYAAAISAWFDKQRGLALGIVVAASGLGGPILAFYAKYLLDHYGWRAGYLGIGILVGVVGLFCLVGLVRMPASYGTAEARAERLQEVGVPTLREIYTKSRIFWLMGVPVLATSLFGGGILGSLVPLMTDRGLSMTAAVSMLTVFSVATMISPLIVGYVVDKIFIPYVAVGIWLTGMVGLLLIWLGAGEISIFLAIVCLGFCIGPGHNLLTILVSRYFPYRAYSKVLGALWILANIGGSSGNFLAGWTFDRTKSYDTALMIFVALTIVAVSVILRLGPYLSEDAAEAAFTPTVDIPA